MASNLGAGMQLTATSWLALDGGPFTVGVVIAARMVPNLLGLAGGTLADRGDRARLLVIVRLASLPITLALAWLATGGEHVNVPVLVALSFLSGSISVFDVPARQALVMDTVPREVAANAMSLNATAARLFTALGAFLAGVLIPLSGVPSCFVVATVVFVGAAALILPIRPGEPHAFMANSARPTFGEALQQAGRLVIDLAKVRTLVIAAIACEIFGFSFMTAVPAFARDVLGAGAEGLGALNAATSLGGAAAVISLSLVPGRLPREPLLGLVFVVYGASLLALALSHGIVVAAAVLLVTGACAASFDVLQQTLLQLAVPEDQRGRAVGLWVLGIGSAPLGNLEMGALVAVLGAPLSLAINGTLVLLSAITLLMRAPLYRRLLVRAPN